MRRAVLWVLVVLVALVAGFCAREFLLTFTRVAGDSMEGTLVSGDVAMITKYDYINAAPERLDVVQLEIPSRGGKYLKRVIGLPGERVDIISGVVHINGIALAEPYATSAGDDFSITLREGEYFVLGDNRPESYDSREEDIGAIGAESFLGRVRAIVWPLDRITFDIN